LLVARSARNGEMTFQNQLSNTAHYVERRVERS
jgi:hypothetical protein